MEFISWLLHFAPSRLLLHVDSLRRRTRDWSRMRSYIFLKLIPHSSSRGRRKSFVFWGDFRSLLFEGPRRKKPTIEGFPLTNWWWGFFFHWLTYGTPLSRSTAFFVVDVLSVSGQNGDKIVIRCLFLVINFYVHSIALLDYQNICFSLIFAIFDITMKWLCLHPEMNREKIQVSPAIQVVLLPHMQEHDGLMWNPPPSFLSFVVFLYYSPVYLSIRNSA